MRGAQLFASALAAAGLALGAAPAAPAADSLVDAASAGDREAVLSLLASGGDVNAAWPDGSTALLWAAHNGDAALVEALIEAGADAGKPNDFGATPMSEAAVAGDAAVIALLLEAGADAESANAEGQTALMAVARTGRVDAAKLLVDAGANVNAAEQWGGQTALMWAAAQCQPDMIRFLIGKGADPDARGTYHQWGRRVTAESRTKDMNFGGYTALLYAAREGCVEGARALVEGGADIELVSPNSITPLLMATMNIQFDTAAYLIEAGADVNRWDLWGRSPLYMAVDLNTTPRGSRPDQPPDDATTGLEVARMLLERGANVNVQLKLFPPYRHARDDRGGDPILTIDSTPLLRAAKSADLEAIELLLEHHPLVDLPNNTGTTPLMVAAGLGYGGADTRGKFTTEAQSVEAVKLLLAAGADINAKNQQGQTALFGAVQRGWPDMIRLLAENGADLEARNAAGLTPADVAAGKRPPGPARGPASEPKPEIVSLLQQLAEAKAKGL